MEDAVHPFEGADQGFFVSDVSLKQSRKGWGWEVHGLVRSPGCPASPGAREAGAREAGGRVHAIPQGVTILISPVCRAKSQEHAQYFVCTISSSPHETP